MPYADLDNLLADYLPEVEKTEDKDAVGRMLDGVSAFVDTFCNRSTGYFNPSQDHPQMKRQRGEGERFLRLPVHVFGSITEVSRNGEVIDSAKYYESEKNGWLYFEDTGDYWEDGLVYKVTGRWGYEATPKDLQMAVCQTVCKIWEIKKGTLGQITPNGFVIERAMPPFAKEVFLKYKKRQFEI